MSMSDRPQSPAVRLADDTLADLDGSKAVHLRRLEDIVAAVIVERGADLVIHLAGYVQRSGGYSLGWEVNRDDQVIRLFAIDDDGDPVAHDTPEPEHDDTDRPFAFTG